MDDLRFNDDDTFGWCMFAIRSYNKMYFYFSIIHYFHLIPESQVVSIKLSKISIVFLLTTS